MEYLVVLIVARSGSKSGNRHTYTQTKYRNTRACMPRVNEVGGRNGSMTHRDKVGRIADNLIYNVIPTLCFLIYPSNAVHHCPHSKAVHH